MRVCIGYTGATPVRQTFAAVDAAEAAGLDGVLVGGACRAERRDRAECRLCATDKPGGDRACRLERGHQAPRCPGDGARHADLACPRADPHPGRHRQPDPRGSHRRDRAAHGPRRRDAGLIASRPASRRGGHGAERGVQARWPPAEDRGHAADTGRHHGDQAEDDRARRPRGRRRSRCPLARHAITCAAGWPRCPPLLSGMAGPGTSSGSRRWPLLPSPVTWRPPGR